MICLFRLCGYFIYYMLSCAFFCFVLLQIFFFIMSGTKCCKKSPLKMGAIKRGESDGWGATFELAMDNLGP